MSESGYPIDPAKFKQKTPFKMPSNANGLSGSMSDFSDINSDFGGNPPLLQQYTSEYRKYIDLIDQMRALGMERELPLPRVAVIGVQSCGKSSVLEGISGVCLPRGIGTVTRCPVVLQMKYNPDPFSDWSGSIFYQDESGQTYRNNLANRQAVASEVVGAQKVLAGNHGLSTKPVTVEIVSHHVPDLTLIDLPGLIEVPMPNQPQDLPDNIYGLVRSYIATKETIIMVVVASNSEIATTKALKMANEVDPDGSRTLGVLTKPDLIDKGTEGEIQRMIANPEHFRIKKGFTVVKLRSQADVSSDLSLDNALHNEEKFFESHSHFKHLPEESFGIHNLATKLTKELVTRIKEVLPSLKEETHAKLMEAEKSLKRLGVDVPRDERARQHYLTDNLNKFVNKVCRICEGIYDTDVDTEMRLLYWTRPVIEEFAQVVEEMCPNGDDRTLLDRIAKEIREQRGMQLPGFLPFKACQNIIISLLRDFILPSKTCLFKINACVETFLTKMSEENFKSFPALERRIKETVDGIQRQAFEECDKSIDETFQMEYLVMVPDLLFYKAAYGGGGGSLNFDVVSHESASTAQEEGQHQREQARKKGFRKGRPAQTSNPPPEVVPGESSQSEATNFTMDKIAAYFKSALDRLMGTIPMKVHWYLIARLSEKIQSNVIALATDSKTLTLLEEDEKTAQIRRELEERIARLTAAQNELTMV